MVGGVHHRPTARPWWRSGWADGHRAGPGRALLRRLRRARFATIRGSRVPGRVLAAVAWAATVCAITDYFRLPVVVGPGRHALAGERTSRPAHGGMQARRLSGAGQQAEGATASGWSGLGTGCLRLAGCRAAG